MNEVLIKYDSDNNVMEMRINNVIVDSIKDFEIRGDAGMDHLLMCVTFYVKRLNEVRELPPFQYTVDKCEVTIIVGDKTMKVHGVTELMMRDAIASYKSGHRLKDAFPFFTDEERSFLEHKKSMG